MTAPALPEGEGVAAVLLAVAELLTLARRAMNDPGQFSKRAGRRDNPERLDQWQNRALTLALKPWLVEHDRAVRAEAWDEGWDARNDDYWSGDRNPYRPEASA